VTYAATAAAAAAAVVTAVGILLLLVMPSLGLDVTSPHHHCVWRVVGARQSRGMGGGWRTSVFVLSQNMDPDAQHAT
jgi:hypothetical protein